MSNILKASKNHCHNDWSPAQAFEAGFQSGVDWAASEIAESLSRDSRLPLVTTSQDLINRIENSPDTTIAEE